MIYPNVFAVFEPFSLQEAPSKNNVYVFFLRDMSVLTGPALGKHRRHMIPQADQIRTFTQ